MIDWDLSEKMQYLLIYHLLISIYYFTPTQKHKQALIITNHEFSLFGAVVSPVLPPAGPSICPLREGPNWKIRLDILLTLISAECPWTERFNAEMGVEGLSLYWCQAQSLRVVSQGNEPFKLRIYLFFSFSFSASGIGSAEVMQTLWELLGRQDRQRPW